MGYFEEIDAWLERALLGGPEDEEPEEEWLARMKSQFKGKLLESYRNGQKAGFAPKAMKDDSKAEAKAPQSRWPRRAPRR